MGTKQYDSATDLITLTRASGGTALRKISYGNELVTNGDFLSGTTGWVDGTTYSGALDASSGKLLITTNSSSGYGCAIQGVSLVAGKAYRLTGSRRAVSGGNPAIGLSLPSGAVLFGILGGSASTVTNDFSVTFVCPSSTFKLCLFNQSPTNGNSSEFDNISVKEVLFDQPDGTLQLFNNGNNVPRIEYDADGTVKGLLIEEARTNLFFNSNNLGVSWGAVRSSVTAASGTSPSGLSDAWRWTNVSLSPLLYQTSIYTVQEYTISAWVKSNGAGKDVFRLWGANSQTSGDFTATSEWARYSYTFTPASALTGNGGLAYPSANNGVDVLVYGMQLEAGSSPSSYIPTTSATVTRAIDVATISTSSFGYNKTKGTVVVEFKSNRPVDEQYGAFVLSDGTPSNRLGHYTTSTQHKAFVLNEGSVVVDVVVGNRPASDELLKFCFAFAENNFTTSLNGVLGGTDTSGAFTSNMSVLALGHYYPTSPEIFTLNGHIKSIKYYPRKLTDAQLQELTT